jgi:putative ABC transport system permease protein
MKMADLGFDNEDLFAIHVNKIDNSKGEAYDKIKLYKEVVEQQKAKYNISEGTVSENIPGYYYQNSFILNPTDAVIDELLVISTAVDEFFPEVFGIDMIEGRYFSPEFGTDQTAFIINETARNYLGWSSIDGKFLKFNYEGEPFPVVGVIKDIHTSTLKEPIKPMVYRFGDHNNFPGFISFRIDPLRRTETIEFLKSEWERMFPELPFGYFNVREKYFENYNEEKRIAKIIGSFTLIAILLSVLGLFGLVAFLAEQRQKEIGIRKVNGASRREILALMNRIFVKWVTIAFLLSCPIAWYVVRRWLQEFAYRMNIDPLLFIMGGAIALTIALLAVSRHSWQAANQNPVKSLKYE